MSFLLIEGLCKRYGTTAALTEVGLSVASASRTVVIGPSGSGKTTLLRLIAGFEKPDAGRIVLDGTVLADGRATVPPHQRRIGIVAQDGALFPHLTVAENIGFGLPARMPGRANRIDELMAMVELDGTLRARHPDQLSGGQQQRVALARAMARQPRLMLLDEPFSALDTGLRTVMRGMVAGVLGRAGIPAVLVTHDQTEALSFADQLAVLRAGSLVQAGAPRELYDRPADPATAAFLGEALILPATARDGWVDCVLGRVPVPAAATGAVTVMLRPEQLLLARPDASSTCTGQVRTVDFAGSGCTYGIEVRSGTTGPQALTIRSVDVTRFEPGDAVGIRLKGKAHVFPN